MTEFATRRLGAAADVVAPDGAEVRVLLALAGGSLAHFSLAPGQTSKPVNHRTVEEIWFFLAGRGQLWRRQGERREIVNVHAGICLTIPLGTDFQFRSLGEEPLAAVAVTMPPWPGAEEAVAVEGEWEPTVL